MARPDEGIREVEVLTLERLAAQPELGTSRVVLADGSGVVFRPLERGDVEALGAFLARLSLQTRSYYNYPSYDLAMARELCEAIARYDKLRMVAVAGSRIIGIVEFSLSIVPSDVARYRGYGMESDE